MNTSSSHLSLFLPVSRRRIETEERKRKREKESDKPCPRWRERREKGLSATVSPSHVFASRVFSPWRKRIGRGAWCDVLPTDDPRRGETNQRQRNDVLPLPLSVNSRRGWLNFGNVIRKRWRSNRKTAKSTVVKSLEILEYEISGRCKHSKIPEIVESKICKLEGDLCDWFYQYQLILTNHKWIKFLSQFLYNMSNL